MLYSFDSYTLDTDRRELRRGQDLVAVEPQVFDLLEFLIRHRERVVTRDDILDAVWNGRAVSESALAVRINAVRLAIADSGQRQRLIRTLPRKGVRFIGNVREHGVSPAPAVPEDEETVPAVPIAHTPSPLPAKPSVAVLPFVFGHAKDETFADGLTEDIITALSRISALFVIARTSTFTYKNVPVDVRQVGRELDVRYVLEGSLRRSGSRLRITAQLLEAETGHHVWAEKYDCTAADIFKVQDEISQSIAAAVQTNVRIHEGAYSERWGRTATTTNLANKAWNSLYKLTQAGLLEARASVNQAFGLQTENVRLYQIAAAVEFHEFFLGYSTDHCQLARGLSLAEKAVSLDPSDEYSYWIFGILSAYVGQHDVGIAALRRAIELNPNFALGHGSLATILAYAGAPEEAIRENEIALRLNPRDPSNFFRHYGFAVAHLFAANYHEAARWAQMVASGKPDWNLGHVMYIASLAAGNRMDEAISAKATFLLKFPGSRIRDVCWLPIKSSRHRESFVESLHQAGLPA